MVTSVLDFNSEAGFLQCSFVEFVKCWSMGTTSTFHVESRNGEAFLNFSAYLGSPRNVHFFQNNKPKSKSERKTRRDNERAAMFRANQNQSSNSSTSTPVLKLKENANPTNLSDNGLDATANSTFNQTFQGEESSSLSETTAAADGLDDVNDDNSDVLENDDNCDVLENDDQDVSTGDDTTAVSSFENRDEISKGDDKYQEGIKVSDNNPSPRLKVRRPSFTDAEQARQRKSK